MRVLPSVSQCLCGNMPDSSHAIVSGECAPGLRRHVVSQLANQASCAAVVVLTLIVCPTT